MNLMTVRKKRLEQLLELAQAYKGCSRRELARAVGRDPTKIVPGTGIPKLDLVMELAGVLDWPIGEVANFLWPREPAVHNGADFESLNRAAGEEHRSGRYDLALELAQQAWAVAETPEQRARACNREAGAWDGLGRYTDVLQATKRGLQESGVGAELRRTLQSNLANAYYCLWALVESGSIAQGLLDWFDAEPPRTMADRKTHAFAYYVSGHTLRRLMSLEPDRVRPLAADARHRLSSAFELYRQIASETGDESLVGIANTCHGGMIEADVALGRRSPADALAELTAGLEQVRDVNDGLVGDRLESYGWWCIFGCNIALRHLECERQLQQTMAVLTNKADEIADRLDNWAMRERVFTMQHTRWERAMSSSGFEIPCVIDTDDVRVIAGAMGRVPAFRDTGWRILQSARIVDDH